MKTIGAALLSELLAKSDPCVSITKLDAEGVSLLNLSSEVRDMFGNLRGFASDPAAASSDHRSVMMLREAIRLGATEAELAAWLAGTGEDPWPRLLEKAVGL